MNDHDIDLITSLIGGELSEPEQADALARIGSDPELQAAYDAQFAVASMLTSAPTVAMTADESAALRATLRTELHLGEASSAVVATASGWNRWWAPLTGLAAAAAVVLAIVVLPGALDGTDSADVVSAPLTESTTAPSELNTLGDGEAQLREGVDSAAEAAPSTTMAAAAEPADPGVSEEIAESEYFLSPLSSRQDELELPVVDDDALASAGLADAAASSGEFSSVNLARLSSCFAVGAAGSALEPVGITPDLSAVYAIATDLETGIETSVTIDLSTCEVTGAG